MADEFLTKTKCDHGGGCLDGGRTMSRFNTACLCMRCAEADLAEIRKGNRQVGMTEIALVKAVADWIIRNLGA